MSTSPIADLSYRGYDGPLEGPRGRWLTVARNLVNQAFRKRIYWVLVLGSGWYYAVMLVIVFFTEKIATGFNAAASRGGSGAQNGVEAFIRRLIWKDQFINGYNFGQMTFMIIALFVAAGAIANDTRSNALLVYLSKPCTKLDYLAGKWLGSVVCVFTAMAVPSVFYYLFGALSYQQYGFFSDPWLLPKSLLGMLIGAMIHASVALGFSALFKQGRMAGAAYAALYLFSSMFAGMMLISWRAASMDSERGHQLAAVKPVFERLSSCSIEGLLMGIFKKIVGSDGSPPFGIPVQSAILPSPPLIFSLGIGIVLCLMAAAIMWNRVRAVEVIGK